MAASDESGSQHVSALASAIADELWRRNLDAVESAIPSCSGWTSSARGLVSAMVAASGDLGLAGLTRVDEDAVEAGVAAVRHGQPILCDVPAAAGAVSGLETLPLDGADASAIQEAIIVIGERVDLLAALTREIRGSKARPALVIATPAGFVGAAEAKEELTSSGVPYVTVEGTRGGPSVAAAAANALIEMARADS